MTEQDARSLWNLRLHALETVPEAFGESAQEHQQTPVEKYAERLRSTANESAVIGAFEESALVGMIGLYRDQRAKRRHKGWIWGMFVEERYRGTGLGRALLEEAISTARNMLGLRCVLLSVTGSQESARRLYLSAGFRPYGIEPQALKVDDRYLDEEHMIMEI